MVSIIENIFKCNYNLTQYIVEKYNFHSTCYFMYVKVSTVKHPHQKVFHTLDKNELINTKNRSFTFLSRIN